jgi:hypothetical protein
MNARAVGRETVVLGTGPGACGIFPAGDGARPWAVPPIVVPKTGRCARARDRT